MDKRSLDFSTEKFKALLEKSNELVLQKFEDLDTQKAFHDYPQKEVESWFDESLPEDGMDGFEVLKEVSEKVLETANGNMGPHMYAYVVSGGTQMSIIAEKLVATINQNGGKWHLAPAISEIEKRVVQWGAQMMGVGDTMSGVLVSGGSAANLAGLTVARNLVFEKLGVRKKGLFGFKPFVAYASREVHGCVDKSLDTLGIGTDNLRKINTLPDFTIDVVELEDQIKKDIENGLNPFCIIGNAGTVNTGAIDDLEALAALSKKYNLWFHVDGAYGGLAASLPSQKLQYKGMEKADSIAIDFHKWLYQPFEAGCIMVKNWEILRKAYYKNADYLDTSFEDKGRLDFNEHHFQLSRNAKSLKIWMSLKTYGAKGIREMIQKDVDLTIYLGEQIEKADDFILKSAPQLGITCFQYKGNLTAQKDIVTLNEKLIPALEKDGRVFITGTKLNGEFVLRACLINHRKQKHTIDYLLNVIRQVAEKVDR